MPGVTRSSLRGRPRETPARRSHLAGCILWLPSRDELPEDSNLDEGIYKHPVVILSPQLDDGKVVVLIITSFGGTDLATKHKNDLALRLAHLPIKPCSAHPDNGMLLHLEDSSLKLRKRSYVKAKNRHQIKFKSLETYERQGPEYVLARSSYQDLIKYIKYTVPLPHPLSNTVSSSPLLLPGQAAPVVQRPASAETRRLNPEPVNSPRRWGSGTANTRIDEHLRHVRTWSSQPRNTITRPVFQPNERQSLLPTHEVSPYRLYGAHPRSSGPTYGSEEPSEPRGMFWLHAALWSAGLVAGSYVLYLGYSWAAGEVGTGAQFIAGDAWTGMVDRFRGQTRRLSAFFDTLD
ncbi:hypothetical protein F4779DRAFT_623895 [Xylariaceae sp. FL0662B]|nr:hypothetical protein F4779DRAFT_623895 [Xylariaceae sp. FL0662B]